jgi:hypothetical protein
LLPFFYGLNRGFTRIKPITRIFLIPHLCHSEGNYLADSQALTS